MAQTLNSLEIEIIQGDNYALDITLAGIENELIDSVYFTSKYLGICRKMNYDSENNMYSLEFSAVETKEFMPGTSNYDITIKFADGTVETIRHQSPCTVLRKNNKVVCE